MGEIAARTLLDRLRNKGTFPNEVAVEPELVIRESTTTRLRPSAPPPSESVQASAISND